MCAENEQRILHLEKNIDICSVKQSLILKKSEELHEDLLLCKQEYLNTLQKNCTLENTLAQNNKVRQGLESASLQQAVHIQELVEQLHKVRWCA